MSTGINPQCYGCRHLLPLETDGWTCQAFPDGIPKDIIVNRVSHKFPYPGDHGIQFASREIVRAAGVALVAPGGKVLMLRRGPGAGDHPGEWCFPGGHIEPNETAEQAAIRECKEEVGQCPIISELAPWSRRIKDNVDFTTFLGRVADEFVPILDGESDDWAWVDVLELMPELRADDSVTIADVVAPFTPPEKLDRSVFLYMDPRTKIDFAQCATCRDFMPGLQKCAILDIEVGAEWSCGLYVVGAPSDEQTARQRVTPREAGLVDARVRCEHCAAFDDGTCDLYKKLNSLWPLLFELDDKVDKKGCCNGWHPPDNARADGLEIIVREVAAVAPVVAGPVVEKIAVLEEIAAPEQIAPVDEWTQPDVLDKLDQANALLSRDDDADWEETKHPRAKDGKFAKKGQVSSGVEDPLKAAGFKAPKGSAQQEAHFSHPELEHPVSILAPQAGKKYSTLWQHGTFTGEGGASLNKYLKSLGVKPGQKLDKKQKQQAAKAITATVTYAPQLPMAMAGLVAQFKLAPASDNEHSFYFSDPDGGFVQISKKPNSEGFYDWTHISASGHEETDHGLDFLYEALSEAKTKKAEQTPTVAKAVSDATTATSALSAQDTTTNSLSQAGWAKGESAFGATVFTHPSGHGKLEVYEDGSWASSNGILGDTAAELVSKGVISLADQPDAAFEALHPRGPNGQFIAKIKTDFAWLGDVQQLETGHVIALPNAGTLAIIKEGAWLAGWTSDGKPEIYKGTDQESLQKFLQDVDKEYAKSGTKIEPAEVTKPPIVNPTLNLVDLKKVGPQLGSNEGGTYEAADGTKYYIKLPASDAHARNEILASQLYRLAGGHVLDYHLVQHAGGLGVGTKLVQLDVANVSALNTVQRKEAQKAFAIHAWLANWDVCGVDGSNIGTVNGQPISLDLGGSLLYRAQGKPKGAAFNDNADEWHSLRDAGKNPQSAALFAGMSDDDLKASAALLKNVTHEQILSLVNEHGPGDKAATTNLAKTLEARRQAILKYAEAKAPEKPKDPGTMLKELAKHRPSISSTESLALSDYKGSGYHTMNDCARFLIDCDDERVKTLQGWLNKARLPATKVYRAVGGDYANRLWKLIKKGRVLHDPGFVSTTTSLDFAKGWAFGIVFEINVPEGSLGATVSESGLDAEHEVLLQKDSRWVIEHVQDNHVIVTLDQSHLLKDLEPTAELTQKAA